MPEITYNRAKMTTTTTGTGTITLGTPAIGFQSFAAAGVTDGDEVRYVIEDAEQWEIGIGVYTASGATLSRSNIEASSNAGSAIGLSGSATVFASVSAADHFFNGRLLNVQTFTAAGSDTYTPTAGTKRIVVEMVGGGGGGGYADSDVTGTLCGSGGGGGAGAWLRAVIDVTVSTYAVVVGAGGAGAVTEVDGTSGGDTTFTSNGDSGASVTLTAGGGSGGKSAAERNAHFSGAGNGGGASSSGADIIHAVLSEGGSGGTGWGVPSNEVAGAGLAIGGRGGHNQLSEGEGEATTESADSSSAGNDGNRGGAGGGGAASLGSAAARQGGDGAPGEIIIYEFK